ncbi:hypothetical protein [Streptomyces tanashiensis]|uniref:LigA protein n=1 Tax=Streptomyces tanashiensis TaxID=67367 RepID=A0ABY6QVH2_9ACTN|nr:hypothetical protein [Streptomyces tanashiensis]UZX21018.1 hypothetical protein LDH80_09955 [Streptomyces tanashiensis]
MDHQRSQGLRHFGEALVGDGELLSFVDGLFLCVGQQRRHVGAERLRDLAAARPSQAPLLRLLADVQSRDAALLRRILLHQLILLLGEPGGLQQLSGLALVPAESTVLEQAARTLPVLDARQRKAAESLGGLWRHRRLRAVARALDVLGPVAVRTDPALASLASRLGRRLDRCDRSLAAGRATRDPQGARIHYVDALGVAADDDTATRALILLGRPRPQEDSPLTARLDGDRVLLSWPVRDGRNWRAVRLTRGSDRPAGIPVPGTRGSAVDHGPQRGTLVRYAVFPLADGVVDAPPLVSQPLLVAPDVEDLTVADGPACLAVRWTRPPRTPRVTVTVHAGAPAGAGDVLARHDADTDTHTFTQLRPGSYLVRVVCHHSSPEGRVVESAGVQAAGTVHLWPEPLTALTAEPDPAGGVRFAGRGADGADVRLVAWADPIAAPPQGACLRTDALPARLPWAAYGTDRPVEPPSGFSGLITAVSVLGERAVAGPSVRVDIPAPVTGLRGLRESDGHVRLVFDWPDGAGAVEVEWEQSGVRERTRTSRSRFLREGLRLPIGPASARIGVRAASRHEPHAEPAPEPEAAAHPGSGTDGTVVVRRAPAALTLPGDVVVSFRLVTRRRGLSSRRPVAVEVTVTGGLREGAPDTGTPLPDFVLVRRGGDAASARPRHHEDGDVLVRLTGTELAASSRTTHELPPGLLRPPYALRAFLAGENAASVRLEEPALSTLVVR